MLKIKELRLSNNLSQKELADKLGISNKSICAYESGYAVPKIDTLIKMAEIFNCSVDFLLGLYNNYDKCLITKFNSLNEENKIFISKLIETTLDNQHK